MATRRYIHMHAYNTGRGRGNQGGHVGTLALREGWIYGDI